MPPTYLLPGGPHAQRCYGTVVALCEAILCALVCHPQEHDEGVSDAECGEHLFKDAAVGNEATAASIAGVTQLGKRTCHGHTALCVVLAGGWVCWAEGRQPKSVGRRGGGGRYGATADREPTRRCTMMMYLYAGGTTAVQCLNVGRMWQTLLHCHGRVFHSSARGQAARPVLSCRSCTSPVCYPGTLSPSSSRFSVLLLLLPLCVSGPEEVPGLHGESGYRCLVAGQQTLRRGGGPTTVDVLMAVLRLPRVNSDLAVTLTTPHAVPAAAAAANAEQLMREVLRSLKVLDWSLFGHEG